MITKLTNNGYILFCNQLFTHDYFIVIVSCQITNSKYLSYYLFIHVQIQLNYRLEKVFLDK